MSQQSCVARQLLGGLRVFLLVAFCGRAMAADLWDGKNILADRRLKKHDLVTIFRAAPKKKRGSPVECQCRKKSEPASPAATRSAKGSGKKESGQDAAVVAPINAVAVFGGWSFTARVAQVLPNGNLILEAETRRVQGRVRTQIRFSGLVAAEDVSAERRVALEKIGDVRLAIEIEELVPAIARKKKKGKTR